MVVKSNQGSEQMYDEVSSNESKVDFLPSCSHEIKLGISFDFRGFMPDGFLHHPS